jgi:cell division control protein 6
LYVQVVTMTTDHLSCLFLHLQLHESFSSVCRHQNVAAVEQGEFHALCGLLEARGLLALSRAKDTRSVKVTLRLDDNELEAALQDKTLMSAVLAKGLK